MRVLVDTNVITDVLYGDPVWETWSDAQINRWQADLWINPIIYAELSYRATSTAEVDQVVTSLGLQYAELSKQALYLASQAFKAYRQRGGTRTAPLPDFFIGAQAQAEGFTLLTRDKNRFETYFPNVPLICP